ncbi:MAG: tRNA lysidine(34) synthetase TilS [Selenomonadaceae bacterium]|nr:tRNA lysidine(34) synthetase TilS [Selenomonadaceae bacterium]
MLQHVEEFCRRHGLFGRGEGIVVACSGGPDSMALAQFLYERRKSWGLRLCIAHFEHGIRGQDSLQDAMFVGDWCREHGLMFRMTSEKVPLLARQKGISLETAARELRYGFLERLRRELGYDSIATAHHADDQAETVLLRILRGSGMDGLAAMLPRSGHIVRPFLSARKRELEDFCAARGLEPRHDATNDIPACTRNRVRLDLLPRLMRDYNPGIVLSLCHLAELAAEQRDYIAGEVQGIFPAAVRHGEVPELSQVMFRSYPSALQRALLRRFVQEAGGGLKDLEFHHFSSLRDLLLHGGTGERRELPGGWMAELSYGWMRLFRWKERLSGKELPEYALCVPGRTLLPEYGICVEAFLLQEKPEPTASEEYYCDYGCLPGKVLVRTRRQGDRISLPMGHKSLKKLLIDEHVPKGERDRMPVFVSGNEVLWLPRLRRSSLYAVGPSTERVLYLRVEKLKKEGMTHDEG